MSTKKEKLIVLALVLVASACAVVAVTFLCKEFTGRKPSYAMRKKFAAGTPRAAMEKVRHLQRMLGMHRSADGKITLTKRYDEKTLTALLEALDSQYPTVRARAAGLTRLVVEQLDLPESALHEIAREVRPLSDLEITDDMDIRKQGLNREQGEAILRARRVLWQIGLKRLDSDQLKLAFFRDQLLGEKADSVDPYLKMKIVEYLGEMAVREAKAILEDYLKASKRMNSTARNRVKRAIQKIVVSRSLSGLKPSVKLEKLIKILEESPDVNMRVWAVREIGKVGDDTAISQLQDIFDNEQYKIQLRYEAQETLKTLGVLPEDVYRIASP